LLAHLHTRLLHRRVARREQPHAHPPQLRSSGELASAAGRAARLSSKVRLFLSPRRKVLPQPELFPLVPHEGTDRGAALRGGAGQQPQPHPVHLRVLGLEHDAPSLGARPQARICKQQLRKSLVEAVAVGLHP